MMMDNQIDLNFFDEPNPIWLQFDDTLNISTAVDTGASTGNTINDFGCRDDDNDDDDDEKLSTSFASILSTEQKKSTQHLLAQDKILEERFNLLSSNNLLAFLISYIRSYCLSKKIPAYNDQVFKLLAGCIGHSSNRTVLCSLFHRYNSQAFEECLSLIKTISSTEEFLTTLQQDLRQFRINLYPSLVGSANEIFSEKLFAEVVDDIHQHVRSRWKDELNLQQKIQQKEKIEQEVMELSKQCFDSDLINSVELIYRERNVHLKLLKEQATLLEKQKEAREQAAQVKANAASYRAEYSRLVLENHELTERKMELLAQKENVMKLNPNRVAELVRLWKERQFVLQFAQDGGQHSSRSDEHCNGSNNRKTVERRLHQQKQHQHRLRNNFKNLSLVNLSSSFGDTKGNISGKSDRRLSSPSVHSPYDTSVQPSLIDDSTISDQLSFSFDN